MIPSRFKKSINYILCLGLCLCPIFANQESPLDKEYKKIQNIKISIGDMKPGFAQKLLQFYANTDKKHRLYKLYTKDGKTQLKLLRKIYKEQALEWHPDRHTSQEDKDKATEIFKWKSKAMKILEKYLPIQENLTAKTNLKEKDNRASIIELLIEEIDEIMKINDFITLFYTISLYDHYKAIFDSNSKARDKYIDLINWVLREYLGTNDLFFEVFCLKFLTMLPDTYKHKTAVDSSAHSVCKIDKKKVIDMDLYKKIFKQIIEKKMKFCIIESQLRLLGEIYGKDDNVKTYFRKYFNIDELLDFIFVEKHELAIGFFYEATTFLISFGYVQKDNITKQEKDLQEVALKKILQAYKKSWGLSTFYENSVINDETRYTDDQVKKILNCFYDFGKILARKRWGNTRKPPKKQFCSYVETCILEEMNKMLRIHQVSKRVNLDLINGRFRKKLKKHVKKNNKGDFFQSVDIKIVGGIGVLVICGIAFLRIASQSLKKSKKPKQKNKVC